MPANPNLVPTVITNVNGVTTTVHKKPVTQTKVSSIPAPAPTAGRNHHRKTLVRELVTFVESELMKVELETAEEVLAAAGGTLDGYPTELLESIQHSITTDPNSRRKVSRMIRADYDPQTLDECITFLPQVPIHASTAEPVIRSLHLYKQLPKSENFARDDARTQQQCLAIALVAATMDQEYDSLLPDPPLEWLESNTENGKYSQMYAMIKDDRLIDLLMEHPEAAPQIADLIKERHTADYDLVKLMIEGNNAALAEGVL